MLTGARAVTESTPEGADESDPLAGLRQWFASAPGAAVAAQEQRLARDMLANLFGYHIVQLGDTSPIVLLEHSRISHRVVIATSSVGSATASTIASPDRLPIERSSVDVVMLPHTLDLSSNAHGVLRETERVLIGDGYVVIFGFNPWSTFGLWRRVLGWRGRAPWSGKFLSLTRLKDWLGLLGFDLERIERVSYRPPLQNPRWHQRLEFMERLGGYFWPLFGNVYAVLAQKRIATITPIRSRWATRTRLTGNVVEPTVRQSQFSEESRGEQLP
jgi:SAM-dependent methyltransferase